MANDSKTEDSNALVEVDRKIDRLGGCRLRDQRPVKVKDKLEEGRLPTPPPDPQCPQVVRDRGAMSRAAEHEEEEEDLAVYLSDLGASPFDDHTFDYDISNSATSPTMGRVSGACTEETFEHLDRLYALTEQVLELRDRNSKFFRRVRELERTKALRNADRRLEIALANNDELMNDFPEEDTGFAESLLDAMLSNSRDPSIQRRNERSSIRSPSSRQRSRSLVTTEQTLSASSNVIDRGELDKRTSRSANRNGGPKISKWTRVKAAFKWERACTNDLAENVESITSTSATRYLKIPDISTGSWSGSTLSPCTSEFSNPSTPIGRISSASSSNEEVFDDSRRNIVNYLDRQSPRGEKKKDDSDVLITDSIDISNEMNRSKPLIRITTDTDTTVQFDNENMKDPDISTKKLTPILMITIPSNEEEIRSLSSPESMSPLPSSAQDSGGSSPQRFRTRRNIPSFRENKRQYSAIEATVTPASRIQRQDSKWNKVRRAFLTNATFNVPPSPIRTIAEQSFAHDGSKYQMDTYGRDYQALREKFGAEFHRKLIEWERLKSGSPCISARNVQGGLGGGLNEEQLTPEFKKKLQEWKRAKKNRRSSAMIEQQRVGRRRLTDWQLWRSSSKPESRRYEKSSVDFRESPATISGTVLFSGDGKQHPCEDFVKRMEAWRRMNEAACQSNEGPKQPPANRVESSAIDETEFLALEKLLLLFGQRTRQERQENDARQLNDCFDSDTRSRRVNCENEVLIRTSVGSYRFEGISREFTRKLYDWEKYRGISPRSSTFRLLGPSYTPLIEDLDETTLTEPPNATGKSHAFHWTLQRSKSDSSIFEINLRDDSFTLRHSTSLQSLNHVTDKLENVNRMIILPSSDDSRGKDLAEDTTVEDSEPEAMIIDIEDVIEETASPLKRVQPHQTPVYSVAASETTSIAVPLGTVTSSHEPSPVFLVEAEDDNDCERWNSCNFWIAPAEVHSSENSPSPEHFPLSEESCERTASLDEDKSSWGYVESCHKETDDETTMDDGCHEKGCCLISDNDSVMFSQPIGWNRDSWIESSEIFDRYADEANRDSTGVELPPGSIHKDNISGNNTTKGDSFETENAESTQLVIQSNFGSSLSTIGRMEETMDLPCGYKGMTEIREIDDPAEDANNMRKNQLQDVQDNEEFGKASDIGEGSHVYKLAETLSLPDCPDSTKISPSLSSLSHLDDNKNSSADRDTNIKNNASANYEDCHLSDHSQTDEHYEIIMFKTGASNDTIGNRFLYEPLNYYEDCDFSYKNKDNCVIPLSKLSKLETSAETFSDTLRNLTTNSTIQTTSVTMPRENETGCFERIIINEETLNKLIVPTASTEDRTDSAERNSRERYADTDYSNEITFTNDRRDQDCDHASTARITRDDHVACNKKDSTSARNVFVKTKRMIFGPFRRMSEDRCSFSRKNSDESVDSRILRSKSKSKSKSRSSSPKVCRQDAGLRVSLSLPWPSRSSSKGNNTISEIESTVCTEDSKIEGVTTRTKTNDSSCNKSYLYNERENTNKSEEPHVDRKIHRASAKCVTASDRIDTINSIDTVGVLERLKESSFDQQDSNTSDTCLVRDDIYPNIRYTEKQVGKFGCDYPLREDKDEIKCSGMQENGRKLDEYNPKCETVSSDLMHKLKILSDAAAKREGRIADLAMIDDQPESRSSRIRRAKESFLSHPGGPFCRSTIGSTPASYRVDSAHDEHLRGRTDQTMDSFKFRNVSNEIASTSREIETADSQTMANVTKTQDEDQNDRTLDLSVRTELVKSASVGMINVDPDTFDRLLTADRGCESLPRAKRRDTSGPLAKIVNKLRLSRLIRSGSRNIDSGSMSTISTLCRQSLLIDTRGRERQNNERANEQQDERNVEDDDESDD